MRPELRDALLSAKRKQDSAGRELWELCNEALETGGGTFAEVAALLGIAKSTLQSKVRKIRST